MKFISATNFVFISLMALILMPGEQQQATGFDLHLLLLLPLLLIKIGLAAPIVLAVLAKLLLLLGLKKKAIVLPLLLSSSRTSDDSSEGGGYTSPSSDDLGRIKRSVDFVQDVIGKTEVTEEQLLENIFKVDTLRCGEKLLCEVASTAAQKKRVDEDEAALISLFSESRGVDPKQFGPALQVYRDAIISGFRFNDCSIRFPTCPFGRTLMMQLVHMVTGPIAEANPVVDETTEDVPLKTTEKISKIKINPRFELPTSLKVE